MAQRVRGTEDRVGEGQSGVQARLRHHRARPDSQRIGDARPQRPHDGVDRAECVVVDPGMTPLERGQLMTEEDYLNAVEQYGDEFDARMGAEAVLDLLPTAQQDAFAKEDGEQVIDAAGQRVA